jgi:hypothetical protein
MDSNQDKKIKRKTPKDLKEDINEEINEEHIKKKTPRKLTIEDAKELAEKRGGKLISKEYINCSEKLEFECYKGHIFKSSFIW